MTKFPFIKKILEIDIIKFRVIILIGILVLSLAVRLYHFNSPMADLHSWRQSDTASVARNLTRSGLDVLHPRIDSAVSIDGIGRDNTPRYHMAEVPVYQLMVALTSNFTNDIVRAGRVVSILTSLISIYFLYLLTRRYFNEEVSLLSAAIYGVLPYSVFWSRAILPDSMMLMFCLAMLYFFDKWVRDIKVDKDFVKEINLDFVISTIMFGFALIMKVFVPFLLLPMLYLVCLRYKASIWKILSVVVLFLSVVNFYSDIRNSQPFRPPNQVLQIFMEGGHFPLKFVTISVFLLGLYLLYRFRAEFIKIKMLILMLAFAALPFIAWRQWIQAWPMSIPASDWLFDGKKLRFKPAWWHWIFQERLDRYMFNFPGLLFIGLALFEWNSVYEAARLGRESLVSKVKEKFSFNLSVIWFWPLTLLSCLVYLIVFATGNVQHEYYQLPITAFGSVFVALGFFYVWSFKGKKIEMIVRKLVCSVAVFILLLLSWYSVKDWYSIGNPMLVYVGQRADQILPKDAQVVADYGGDTTFLYYVNRKGWSVRDKQIDEMIDRGATHYISMYRNDYINRLATLYKIADESPEYVIMDLREKTDSPEWDIIKRYEL